MYSEAKFLQSKYSIWHDRHKQENFLNRNLFSFSKLQLNNLKNCHFPVFMTEDQSYLLALPRTSPKLGLPLSQDYLCEIHPWSWFLSSQRFFRRKFTPCNHHVLEVPGRQISDPWKKKQNTFYCENEFRQAFQTIC